MISHCSLDELVLFKTREMGSVRELSKDAHTSETKVIVREPPERPHYLPPLVSGSVRDVTFCGHRGTGQGVWSKQENTQEWELPDFM